MIVSHLSMTEGVVAKRQVTLACEHFSASTGPGPRCWFRLSILGLVFIFNFSFMLLQCGLDVEDPTPPSAPVWIQKSLPETWPEQGIDAIELGGIYLDWEDNPISEAIVKYQLDRAEYFELSDSMGGFLILATIYPTHQRKPEYYDVTAFPLSNYYYRLKAIDDSGSSSKYSDSIAYLCLPSVPLETMSPNGVNNLLGEDRKLSWIYDYPIRVENYCVTILDTDNNLIHRQTSSPNNYAGGEAHWPIPSEISLISGKVYKWRVDFGAGYVNGRETAGSESSWASFRYQSN